MDALGVYCNMLHYSQCTHQYVMVEDNMKEW